MSKKILLSLHALIFAGLSILAILTEGTGGGGDSITHFFFAEIAWSAPGNLLDLWAKPFYTLVASPFAQFGFTGIKIFTILCGVVSSYLACLTAERLGKSWYWFIPILAFVAPAFYTYLFSGLTEPFAALISIMAVYFCLSGRVSLGFVLASLLPFIRTEAQVFLLFFAAFGLFSGYFKKIPLLATGYVIYGLIGWVVFKDPLWMLEHPYNSGGSVYGSGKWYHYLERLQVMLAGPGVTLAGLGIIQMFRSLFTGKLKWKTELLLIHGMFFSLLVGHSVVWALGIYGSAGLERTLLTIFPFLWIIMLDGITLLKELSQRLFRGRKYVLPLVYVVGQVITCLDHPITYYYYDRHLNETPNNRFFRDEVSTYLKTHYPDAEHYVLGDPYMAIALDVNFKNPEDVSMWSLFHYPESLPDKTLYVYDSYYVPVHDGISLEDAMNAAHTELVETWEMEDGHQYAVFRKQSY